jgi:hypothetical protein
VAIKCAGSFAAYGQLLRGDLDAIETVLRWSGLFAVYTFKLQRIRGIYVQTREHVVATQLVIELTKHAVKPYQGSM